ncbi:MAG: glucose-6-phosphate dehydrogenase [Gallionella sp.]|nr:glucose-6-phosphate dehydrogenase [Gallionella sp.]MDD4946298.1 glucose-6-phosphate dehydrogenase [Gallionella sp.]MDD5611979.1 glucose-6-phosphate dehydrogenase [Gallionella sp.]
MTNNASLRDTQFVLFGANGDLSWRLIVPALFDLFWTGQLPERFILQGVDRTTTDATALAAHYLLGVAQHSRHGTPDEATWQKFANKIRYIQADISDATSYAHLHEVLTSCDTDWGCPTEKIFYLAIPPFLFDTVVSGLGNAGHAQDREHVRIVVEKPLGHDLETFRQINNVLTRYFNEQQIFRIDHFLGKETVQNILAMRFANPIFEPIWNRGYVDHVTITVAETLGVEKRGIYYEQAGALRDMVQNHLFQLLCLVAMEPPVSYDADDIRNKKVDVLHALRPITSENLSDYAARGQYDEGWIAGTHMTGYRNEPDVDSRSNTETYAALKLYVDNWRWQGVPFYLRTGKRMAAAVSEISIRFRDVPHHAFPASAGLNTQPVRLVIQINPEQGIVLKFMAKVPGSELRLQPVDMRFSYQEAFQTESPTAYETLLRDVLASNATLFMRADQVEMAWKFLTPILETWKNEPALDFPNYAAGSWGPESAESLLAADGNRWLIPTLKKPS